MFVYSVIYTVNRTCSFVILLRCTPANFQLPTIFLRFAPENGFSPPLRSGENLHSSNVRQFSNLSERSVDKLFAAADHHNSSTSCNPKSRQQIFQTFLLGFYIRNIFFLFSNIVQILYKFLDDISR